MSKFLALFSLICASAVCAKQITDQLDRNVTIPDKVSKIVVLQHQSLNVLNEINAMDKVVGVLETWEKDLGKNYLRLAPSLKDMPLAGGLKQANFEEILKLAPDVVIVTNYMPKEQIDKLEELKIPVVAMSFFKGGKDTNKINPTFKDDKKAYNVGFYEGVELLGNVANREKEAAELIEYIKTAQAELKEKMSKIDTKDRVKIYMANPDLTTYGTGKYTGIMFERAGGANVAAAEIKGYKQISAEQLLSWNPDMIFVQERYPQVPNELRSNPLLKELGAIKDGKIFMMPEYVKAWGYPTPEAMGLGEEWLARRLYPQSFDGDFDTKVEQYYQKFYRTSYK